jgi:small-conductance mechanosensitive channel
MFEFLDALPWVILGIIAIIAGGLLANFYEKLIRSLEIRSSWKSTLAFYGKVFFKVGGWTIALLLIPWSYFHIDERVVVFLSLVVGLIAARLDNLLAALTGAATMARVGENIQVGEEIVKIKEKGLFRVRGRTIGGKHVSIGYAQLAGSTFINWTRCPYARGQIDIHVDDPNHNIDAVYEAIDSVIKPEGKYHPDYSILPDEEEAREHGVQPQYAFKGYTGQAPNSHAYRVYFFTRYITEHGGIIHQLQEAILRACTERKISLGQTGNLSASNFKVQIDK